MFVRVNMRVQNRGQEREIFFVLETAHETFAEVVADLRRHRMLDGLRYDVRAYGDGRRQVVGVHETAVMASAIIAVSEMTEDLYDEDGEPIWTADAGEAA